MNQEIPNNNAEQISPAKEARLEEIRAEVEKTVDGIGLKIDEGIKDTVVYFKALGFNTYSSCEGYLERDGEKWNHIPYVGVEAPNSPEHRYEKQQEISERVAGENGISVDEMRRNEKYEKIKYQAWEELVNLHGTDEWPPTKEFADWLVENEKVYKDLQNLLDEFYQDREVEPENELVLTGSYSAALGITNHAGIYNNIDEEGFRFKDRGAEITGDKDEIAQKIASWQEEMQVFTQFLKDKFLKQ